MMRMLLTLTLAAILTAGCAKPRYQADIAPVTQIVSAGKTLTVASGTFDEDVRLTLTVRATAAQSSAGGTANITLEDGAQRTQRDAIAVNGAEKSIAWDVSSGAYAIKAECFAAVDCIIFLSGNATQR